MTGASSRDRRKAWSPLLRILGLHARFNGEEGFSRREGFLPGCAGRAM
jgi:hypothetical protein